MLTRQVWLTSKFLSLLKITNLYILDSEVWLNIVCYQDAAQQNPCNHADRRPQRFKSAYHVPLLLQRRRKRQDLTIGHWSFQETKTVWSASRFLLRLQLYCQRQSVDDQSDLWWMAHQSWCKIPTQRVQRFVIPWQLFWSYGTCQSSHIDQCQGSFHPSKHN